MNQQVENYVMFSETSDDDLEKKVNIAISQGYELVGVPLISVDVAATSENPAQYRYQQAMVKYVNDKQ